MRQFCSRESSGPFSPGYSRYTMTWLIRQYVWTGRTVREPSYENKGVSNVHVSFSSMDTGFLSLRKKSLPV
ncbi:hypothetical protein Y1Q_0020872 [Alligator mississippiensis]|uniref:Uncharacterized protein n=1 Tax=Alligator mississippiensis TaxID=8496 RepID=A0A151NJ68_ALLMI|nr:hypothetical protein Y1Q_0020872 [Alligator mississippiensis]